jgi:hypothetical protein
VSVANQQLQEPDLQ